MKYANFKTDVTSPPQPVERSLLKELIIH